MTRTTLELPRCSTPWLAAALLALAFPDAARAAHPLASDDIGTVGSATGQLELTQAWARERSLDAGVRVQQDAAELGATVSWGLRDDLDLVVGLPLAWSHVSADGAEASTQRGLGDVSVEAKWRFLEAGGFGLAVKPGLTLPTGDAALGLGTGRACFGVALLATQTLGPVSIHLNAAYGLDQYARPEDRAAARRGRWRASTAVVGEVGAGLQLMVDLGLENNGDRASSTPPTFALGGVVYSMTGTVDLDVGVKAGLTAPEPDLAVLAGLTARF